MPWPSSWVSTRVKFGAVVKPAGSSLKMTKPWLKPVNVVPFTTFERSAAASAADGERVAAHQVRGIVEGDDADALVGGIAGTGRWRPRGDSASRRR